MKGGAGGRRRRWWRRGLIAVVVVPLGLFGLSNLWLATPPGRSWIAGKITRATGLPARVGPASWLPWDGLVLRRIEIERPPQLVVADSGLLLEVERIKVEPHWRELWRGRVAVGRVVVDAPAVDLPVELLAHLAAAAVPPEAAGEEEPAEPVVVEPVVPVVPEPSPGAAEPVAGEVVAEPEPQAVELPETSWLVVRGGSFRLGRAANSGGWLAIGGIDARVPVRGKAADGSVSLAELRLAGEEIGSQELPLRWEPPRLSVIDWHPRIGTLQLAVNMHGVLLGSLPFVVECRLPEQMVDGETAGLPGKIAAGQAGGVAVLGGHLRMPSTLAGRGRIEAEVVRVPEGFEGGGAMEFDRCGLSWNLAAGTLRVIDARAVGDSMSLLGNGTLMADGRVAGVLRVVVPEEGAAAMVNRFGNLLPAAPTGFRPMETPDRWMIDCTLGGSFGSEWVRMGDGPERPIGDLMELWLGLRAGGGMPGD